MLQKPERFREIFYNNTAYWIKSDADLKIEFKKYGDNRKNIELCFNINKREIFLSLRNTSEPMRFKEETLKLSDIWIDHSKLYNPLKKLMLEGLENASKTLD